MPGHRDGPSSQRTALLLLEASLLSNYNYNYVSQKCRRFWGVCGFLIISERGKGDSQFDICLSVKARHLRLGRSNIYLTQNKPDFKQ